MAPQLLMMLPFQRRPKGTAFHRFNGAMLKSLFRNLYGLRFWLFQRRRHGRLVLEQMRSLDLVVLPSVFNPTLFFSSGLLARAAAAHPIAVGAQVLDLGCGTGIQGLLAAQRGAHVVATDKNPEAIRAVQINRLLNQLPTIEVLQGDLFEPVMQRRFDLVLWNPPYLRGLRAGQGSVYSANRIRCRTTDVRYQATYDSGLSIAFYATEGLAQRFAQALPAHLSEQGYALVVLSTSGDEQSFLDAFRMAGLQWVAVTRRNMLSEVLTVYKLWQQ
jgi:methylase of polypeptide subunit release factors